MIGLWKAHFRTLIDRLRFGSLTLDQSMVLQGKAFYAYYEQEDVAAGGSIEAFITAPADKSLIVNTRVLAAETTGVLYRVYAGATIQNGTGTPLTPRNRSSKINTASAVTAVTNPTFDQLGTEVDYEPHYFTGTGESKKPTNERYEDGEIKEIGPGQSLRVSYTNDTGNPQTMFLFIRHYEVNTDGIHSGRTDNY